MRNWKDIRGELAERDPGFEEGIARERALLDLERKLYNLRRGRGISQMTLGNTLGTTQENISRIERADDVQLSTLAGYIAGLGGRLELHAVFDDEQIVLTGVQEAEDEPELPPIRPRHRDRQVPANSTRRAKAS